jgi:hypothetical protein
MTDPDVAKARMAQNQVRFREANERIEAGASTLDVDRATPFMCERADRTCVELVRLTFDQYEDIRQDRTRFFTVPGHEQTAVEAAAAVVVERTPGYVLVDKIGIAGRIAAADTADAAASSDV